MQKLKSCQVCAGLCWNTPAGTKNKALKYCDMLRAGIDIDLKVYLFEFVEVLAFHQVLYCLIMLKKKNQPGTPAFCSQNYQSLWILQISIVAVHEYSFQNTWLPLKAAFLPVGDCMVAGPSWASRVQWLGPFALVEPSSQRGESKRCQIRGNALLWGHGYSLSQAHGLFCTIVKILSTLLLTSDNVNVTSWYSHQQSIPDSRVVWSWARHLAVVLPWANWGLNLVVSQCVWTSRGPSHCWHFR